MLPLSDKVELVSKISLYTEKQVKEESRVLMLMLLVVLPDCLNEQV